MLKMNICRRILEDIENKTPLTKGFLAYLNALTEEESVQKEILEWISDEYTIDPLEEYPFIKKEELPSRYATFRSSYTDKHD